MKKKKSYDKSCNTKVMVVENPKKKGKKKKKKRKKKKTFLTILDFSIPSLMSYCTTDILILLFTFYPE